MEERPVRLAGASLKSKNGGAAAASCLDLADEILTRLQKFIKCHRLVDHSLETAPVFRRNLEPRRRKDLCHRAIVAEQVNDERLAQPVVYSFMGEQAPHVEQIAWMLAVERSRSCRRTGLRS